MAIDPDDVIKKAGSFFTKLGGTLKDKSKQVTGIGRGDVKVELDIPRAPAGGTLKGRVVLALTEPVDAKRLVVSLRAHQRIVELQRQNGARVPATTKQQVYHFDLELGGAQRYDSRTVPFELTVPPDALDLKPEGGAHPIADAARAVASVFKPSAGPIEWSVQGRLEIAWGRDLTQSVDVVVTR